MNYEPKTLAEHIDCLARLTGAPENFVAQVRTLFTSKGISLETDAAPFLAALEEAFRREEGIRYSTHQARTDIAKMQQDFRRVGRSYVEQISQIKKLRSSLQTQNKRLRRQLSSSEETTHVTIKGDHRTFVTRFERETQPMVPGPKELQ